nr:hypothetical protein [Natronomonas salsuginis]
MPANTSTVPASRVSVPTRPAIGRASALRICEVISSALDRRRLRQTTQFRWTSELVGDPGRGKRTPQLEVTVGGDRPGAVVPSPQLGDVFARHGAAQGFARHRDELDLVADRLVRGRQFRHHRLTDRTPRREQLDERDSADFGNRRGPGGASGRADRV